MNTGGKLYSGDTLYIGDDVYSGCTLEHSVHWGTVYTGAQCTLHTGVAVLKVQCTLGAQHTLGAQNVLEAQCVLGAQCTAEGTQHKSGTVYIGEQCSWGHSVHEEPVYI